MNWFAFCAAYILWPYFFVSASPLVHFYRSPESLFASGQRDVLELEKARVQRQVKNLILVEKDQRRFWIKDSDLVTGEQLSAGFGLVLISAPLRQEPNFKSNSILHLPGRTQVKILSIQNEFAEISFQSPALVHGFIDINQMASVYDFINQVQSKGVWSKVQYKSGPYLILQNNYRVPLSEVQEFKIHKDLAMVVESQDEKKMGQILNLRSLVRLVRSEISEWKVSWLKGHGEVYWKLAKGADTIGTATENLTSEEILKKEIFSLSFQPDNPKFGILSSHGIYITQDGKNWRRFSEFKNQNFPVFVSNKYEIYVGHFWSQDLGKTFKPFFKFSQLLEHFQKRSISWTRNLKIEALDKKKEILKLKVSTGTQTLDVQFDKKLNTFL